MLVALSGLAALGYGISDFAGGLAARRHPRVSGLLPNQLIGIVITLGVLPLCPGALTGPTAAFAVGAGVSGLLGTWLMYRLMATEPLSVVAPFTAVLAAGTPVLFGLLAGEHLHAVLWIGISAGLVAVGLIGASTDSGSQPGRRTD